MRHVSGYQHYGARCIAHQDYKAHTTKKRCRGIVSRLFPQANLKMTQQYLVFFKGPNITTSNTTTAKAWKLHPTPLLTNAPAARGINRV